MPLVAKAPGGTTSWYISEKAFMPRLAQRIMSGRSIDELRETRLRWSWYMDETTFDRIRGIASDVLAVSPTDLSPESSPESIEAWDSVQHLNLVLAIEQQFDLQFEPEDVDTMHTLGAMAAAVDRKLADRKSGDPSQDRPGA